MAVGTTHGKRRLGRFVKPIRLRSGLSPEQVATRARCSRQTVARLEAGDHLPRIHLFITLLGVIGATADERERALQLWEVADAATAAIEHAEDLPPKYRRFRLDESEAIRERTLDTVIIPGLLQTADYILAISLTRRPVGSGDDWESRVTAERRERQALLTRGVEPLELHALIDVAALRRTIGSETAMAAQLDHLLVASELPNVTIQVIPRDFGAHGAMGGALTIFSYREPEEPDEAYVESVIGIENVGDAQDVAALSAVWDEIAAAAPSATRSAEIIRAIRDMGRDDERY